MGYRFNPFTGNLDIDTTAAASLSLEEYINSDPASPTAGDIWVKHTQPSGAGTPIGLLLSLTQAGSGVEKYELSFFTDASTIIRVEMS